MDDNKKKIQKMAAWTVAVFATVFAVTFAFLWLPIYPQSSSAMSALVAVFAAAWPILLIDLVFCAGLFFGYSAYLKRKK